MFAAIFHWHSIAANMGAENCGFFFFLSSLHVKHVTLFFQRLKFEIAEVMTEIEQLTCIGER